MRILLIEATRTAPVSRFYPHLGLRYLAAFASRYADFELEFLIVAVSEFPKLSQRPDLVGISAVTGNFATAERIAVSAREQLGHHVPILLGGCHVSALASSLPAPFDAGVIGEGEATFLELLARLKARGTLTESDYASIPGLAYRNQSGVARSGPRPLLTELDRIPFPVQRTPVFGIAHVITSRGCPYPCAYCAARSLWGQVRNHSPRYVVEELQNLVGQAGVDQVIFFDDNFLADRKRIREIAEELEVHGLAGRVGFICFGRTRGIQPDLAADLARMGVQEIYLGADTAADQLNERRRSPGVFQRNQRAVDLCADTGMKVDCSFVVGLPHQTPEDLDQVLDFVVHNRPRLKSIQISPVNLFPGTPLWDYAVKKGRISRDKVDWSALESFTRIQDFSLDRYLYLNERMRPEVFADYCKRFAAVVATPEAGAAHPVW
ncbi:MAG: B12-binding domain-containing radical SAM protein [Armatimonadetes bacterium]|nr:B12-binding domain-containing radical SAM protein [Armatimonadota bacterium]